ncbi:MAG: hypothetical protein JXP73_18595 [Deltaproteobacteria bacterium]|jgi:hypothetical protein|nr:hypothetical protein [Deltaproteobacteria bacterium]
MALSDTSSSAGDGAQKAPAVHVPFLVALLFAVAMLKGLRMPSLWATTHMTFNYSHGFVRRGLFGQVLRIFGEERVYRYNSLFLCAAILFLLAALALFLLIRRTLASDRGDRGLQAALLVLAASPGVVFLVHEIGYLDYAGIVGVSFFILWASRARRLFSIFYVAIPMSIVLALIHESMIVMFAPTLLFVMVCHGVTRGAGRPRRTCVLLVTHTVLAATAALAASWIAGVWGTASAEQIRALQESIARHANFPLRGDGFDALGRSLRANLLEVLPTHWSQPVNRNYLITSLGVSLPGLAFLGSYGFRLLGRLSLDKRARWLLTSIFLAATVSPLLLNFIGWDSARWNAIAFLACFFCLAATRLFFLAPQAAIDTEGKRHRIEDTPTLTFAAAAIVTGLCTSYYGYLFDGYVVQWFPFVGQFESAIELVKGGFATIP